MSAESDNSGPLPNDFRTLFAGAPPSPYDRPIPSEHEIAQIKRALEEDRMGEINAKHRRWLVHVLIPSLAVYGCYPPPGEERASDERPPSPPRPGA